MEPVQDCFHKNIHVIIFFLTTRFSNCSVSAKFCPMLVETHNSWGVINRKTYLNHELGSNFIFLNILAYDLVNLLVFEKMSYKMSKSFIFLFFTLLVWDATVPMNLKSGISPLVNLIAIFKCKLFTLILVRKKNIIVDKGELLFSPVGPLTLIYVHWHRF